MPRKCYDVSLKLRAIATAESLTKEAAAREFKVDPRRWCSQKEKLIALKKKGKTRSKRSRGAGRKPLWESMEEELFDWILDLRSRNIQVSRKMIMEKARLASAFPEKKEIEPQKENNCLSEDTSGCYSKTCLVHYAPS